jgi:hypothetical protein
MKRKNKRNWPGKAPGPVQSAERAQSRLGWVSPTNHNLPAASKRAFSRRIFIIPQKKAETTGFNNPLAKAHSYSPKKFGKQKAKMSPTRLKKPDDFVVNIKSPTVQVSARIKGTTESNSGRIKKLRIFLFALFFILILVLIILSVLNPDKWFGILKDFLLLITSILGMLRGK